MKFMKKKQPTGIFKLFLRATISIVILAVVPPAKPFAQIKKSNAMDLHKEGNRNIEAVQKGYAPVNGLKMYYEIHGTGRPLVLIHGGLSAIGTSFGHLLPGLAKTRQIIAVELQGHGHTADIDRPLSYEQMADDVAALIKSLGLKNADVLGYSMGGGVALQTAIRHPDVVRKLVLVSTPYKRDGWYAESNAQDSSMNADTAKAMMQTPVYQFYASVAPRPQDWPTLVTKVGQLLARDYDWSKDLPALKMPILILVGDSDRVRPEHAVEMARLLGGAKMDGGMAPFSQNATPPS